jgi:hypothetical protein
LPGPAEATYKEIFASNNLIDVQPIAWSLLGEMGELALML